MRIVVPIVVHMARTSTKKPATGTSAERERMTVLASHEQVEIITQAAKEEGTDRSTFILAHAMRAVQARGPNSPVVVIGEQAVKLRDIAKRQGISPERLIQQWITAAA